MLRFSEGHFHAKKRMYKGTRHTGQMWGYKSSAVHTASFSSEAECSAILDRCKKTFVTELGIMQAADFQAMVAKMGNDKTKVMAIRLRRGKEQLRNLGVPDTLIFSTPKHLLVAPKLNGLLARLRQLYASRIPVELRDLHLHLNSQAEPRPDANSANAEASAPKEKVLFRVSADGTRTAFTAKASPAEQRRNHVYGGNAPSKRSKEPSPPPVRRMPPAERRAPKTDSALALALRDALERKSSST